MDKPNSHNRSPVLILLSGLACVAIYFLYLPGITSAPYYDDYSALSKLASIDSLEAALNFVFGGTAGPLGRPIALASYLHASDWPTSSVEILRINIIIHLSNALLLGVMSFMILRLRAFQSDKASWIALGAATLWAVLPIIASSSLIVIQRMTTLATLFGLIGLCGFIYGYRFRSSRPELAFIVQFGFLGTGTLLGLFTKESAALFPVYALAIDILLVDRQYLTSKLHNLSRGILILLFLVLLLYLSPIMLDWFAVLENRGWSPWERLQFQVVQLWEYVRLTVAPLPTAFGPFHDHRTVFEVSTLQVLLATLAWIAVAVFSLVIHRRFANPWPLFTLCWFLTGHLLESTVMNLEPVFEHRNYLATFGIALALVVATAHAPLRMRRIAVLTFCAFLLINAATLYAMTSLWGQPKVAAERWAERNPGSARAALHLTFLELGTLDQRLEGLTGDTVRLERMRYAMAVLDRTATVCPDCIDVRIQSLLFACRLEPTDTVRLRFDELAKLSGTRGEINLAVGKSLFTLEEDVSMGGCPALTIRDVMNLAKRMTSRTDSIPDANLARAYFISAKAEYELGEPEAAIDTLLAAEARIPTALPILQFQVYLYQEIGKPEQAILAIDRRRVVHRLDSEMTDTRLMEMRKEISNADD